MNLVHVQGVATIYVWLALVGRSHVSVPPIIRKTLGPCMSEMHGLFFMYMYFVLHHQMLLGVGARRVEMGGKGRLTHGVERGILNSKEDNTRY